MYHHRFLFFFFQAEDGIRDGHVTGVQTCALPICIRVFTPVSTTITPSGWSMTQHQIGSGSVHAPPSAVLSKRNAPPPSPLRWRSLIATIPVCTACTLIVCSFLPARPSAAPV